MNGVWEYPVRVDDDGRPIVVELHDGDTFRLLLDAGCETGLFPWLRLAGVNCPELRDGPAGPAAAAFTAGCLRSATSIDVVVSGRSFNRWVAQVFVDGADLAAVLIEAGHGAPSPG